MKLPASSLYTGSNENSHYRCTIYDGRIHECSSSHRHCLHTHKRTIIIHTPTHICTLYTRHCLPIRVVLILDRFFVFSSSCFCCLLYLPIFSSFMYSTLSIGLVFSLSASLNNSFIGITVFNYLPLSIFDLPKSLEMEKLSAYCEVYAVMHSFSFR